MRKGIELVVDEAAPGHFYWLILDREYFGQPRRAIDRAPGPYPTHRQAMEAGVGAIRQYMEPTAARALAGPGERSGTPAARLEGQG